MESLQIDEVVCKGCMTSTGGVTQESMADPVDVEIQVAAGKGNPYGETADASVQSDNDPPCIEYAVIQMLQSLKSLTETVNRLSEAVERSRAQDEKENARVQGPPKESPPGDATNKPLPYLPTYLPPHAFFPIFSFYFH